jgi:ssDNA-binding Zn-finger/Zn-ribbon topoisomerase 1
MKKENEQQKTDIIQCDTILCIGLSETKVETRYAKDTSMKCPKCGQHRMSKHLQNGKRFCWVGCGWID